jgi:hypothetical protein
MHRHGVVLPNAQTLAPLPMRRVILSREPVTRCISRSTCIAAGFGGPVAAISLADSIS